MYLLNPQRVLPPLWPARTGRKQYSWRNSSKKEVCMHIRIFNPLEFRKEKKELTFKSQESKNCQHRTDDDGMIASSNSDVTRKAVWHADENRLVARKHLVLRKQLLPLSVKSFKGTGRSEEVEISRNITFSEKILIESCGIWDVDEIFCQNSS